MITPNVQNVIKYVENPSIPIEQGVQKKAEEKGVGELPRQVPQKQPQQRTEPAKQGKSKGESFMDWKKRTGKTNYMEWSNS